MSYARGGQTLETLTRVELKSVVSQRLCEFALVSSPIGDWILLPFVTDWGFVSSSNPGELPPGFVSSGYLCELLTGFFPWVIWANYCQALCPQAIWLCVLRFSWPVTDRLCIIRVSGRIIVWGFMSSVHLAFTVLTHLHRWRLCPLLYSTDVDPWQFSSVIWLNVIFAVQKSVVKWSRSFS